MTFFFALWSLFDLILWSSPDSRKTMFFWSFINLLENIVTCLTVYFSYVFLEKKDVAFKYKLFFGLLFLPLLVLMPTTYNMTGFNAVLCEAQQGSLINYFYFLEGVSFFTLVVFLARKIRKTSGIERKQVLYFSFGVIFFVLSFSGANIIGSIASILSPDNPDNWKILQYGLFGMPVFIGFLAFLIVRYQAFNVQLAGAQALVMGLILLIGSQFFFIKTTINFFLTGITLVMAMGFGWMLIRSVKKEIERRDQLQEMSDRLARANDELRKLDNAKSEFISIASHQLRTPLTAIKGFISLILEGSYGKISPEIQDILNKVYASNDRIVQLVENLLNISRIESGRIQYQFEKASIETILKELSDMFFVMTQGRNLTLTFTLPKEKLPLIYMDAPKIREVISNLIDNALKYTEKGGIEVILEQRGPMARITVADTGMGVEPAMIEHLFSKFIRGSKEASRMNVAGTGLGLYVGRSFVEAHHGKIWIESEGLGKGSKFIVELPIV
jgi:signal transduction histidine kinase